MSTLTAPSPVTPSPTPAEGEWVQSVDPASGAVTARYAATDAAALPALLAAARDAQRRWAARPIRERRALLERIRATLFTHRHAVAAAVSAETGKPIAEAMAAEVVIAMDHARFYRRRVRGFLRPRAEWPSQPALWRKRV
ncbi:MAG: aldehyde dehydrogenase family protein, partial [Gemmatimonadaceae bacterium]|nr:aldehyde dehydrogenase family protein [Gemmatimonadaceae bacterium]